MFRHPKLPGTTALAVVALVAAGCGSSSDSSTSADTGGGGAYGGSSGGSATMTQAAASKTATASVGTRRTSLGTILVDAKGRTLYLWEADKTSKSTCNGACAAGWPPLITKGKPTASSGVKASLLGTSKRSNGQLQATYAGHPLYRYIGDKAPGQTNGQDSSAFGADWYVVAPSGEAVD